MIRDVKNQLRVGQYVRTNGDGSGMIDGDRYVQGMVISVQKGGFHVGHNDRRFIGGDKHNAHIDPSEFNYQYSWYVKWRSSADVEILSVSNSNAPQRTQRGADYGDEPSEPKPMREAFKRLSANARKLLDKPIRILIRAGYINGDLDFTEEGLEALHSILLAEHKTKLVDFAKEELKEKKREKKGEISELDDDDSSNDE